MRGIPPPEAGGYMRPGMAVPERQPSLHERLKAINKADFSNQTGRELLKNGKIGMKIVELLKWACFGSSAGVPRQAFPLALPRLSKQICCGSSAGVLLSARQIAESPRPRKSGQQRQSAAKHQE